MIAINAANSLPVGSDGFLVDIVRTGASNGVVNDEDVQAVLDVLDQ